MFIPEFQLGLSGHFILRETRLFFFCLHPSIPTREIPNSLAPLFFTYFLVIIPFYLTETSCYKRWRITWQSCKKALRKPFKIVILTTYTISFSNRFKARFPIVLWFFFNVWELWQVLLVLISFVKKKSH